MPQPGLSASEIREWRRGLSPDFVSLNPGYLASDGAVAAIGHDDRAGHIGRKVGGEDDRRADDVVGLAGAAERGVVEEDLDQLRIGGAPLFFQRRLDEAR